MLEFEIDEHILANDPKNAAHQVRKLLEQGMTVTLDNFGVSAHSANFLETLAVQKIKFSPALIKNIEEDSQIHDLIYLLSETALSKNMQVMASGIHSNHHALALQKLGCTLGQGGFYGGAMSAEAFEICITQLNSAPPHSKLTNSRTGLGSLNSPRYAQ